MPRSPSGNPNTITIFGDPLPRSANRTPAPDRPAAATAILPQLAIQFLAHWARRQVIWTARILLRPSPLILPATRDSAAPYLKRFAVFTEPIRLDSLSFPMNSMA